MSEELIIVTKRQVNDLIREALRDFRDDEPLAFFCECGNERCSQVVWLTGPAYDQARAASEWLALVPGHLGADDRARPSSPQPALRSSTSAPAGSTWEPTTREDPDGRSND